MQADLALEFSVTDLEELRFIAKIARLYHISGMTQASIARQLDVSQATVSRLLKRAAAERIVRVTVSAPPGIHADLEDQLEALYGLKRAIVVDCQADDNELLLQGLGLAAGYYLESTIARGEVIGISSWSSTLLAMVDAMPDFHQSLDIHIVQILGGIGSPSAEVHATRLTERLAKTLNGQATFLPAPGVAASEQAKAALLEDQFVQEAIRLFDQVSLALVGIGDIQPSKLLASSGNVFSPEELETLKQCGAVGDICLNFFDSDGRPVNTRVEKRVIGMSLPQLAQVKRCVGIAGGERKHAAIRGALEGRYINVLITDHVTAQSLVADKTSSEAQEEQR
jgi:DNA-binding transcriptional regulator LsrR (DeoR family)